MSISPAKESRFVGRAVPGRKTKDILSDLYPDCIPVIDHEDLDRVTAEMLAESGVRAVVNASGSSTGTYPNFGPMILAREGVYLLDGVGHGIFDRVKVGDEIEIRGEGVYRGGKRVGDGEYLSLEESERRLMESREAVGRALEGFAENTLEFMQAEREILFSSLEVPEEVREKLRGRQVLVVVRGYDYRRDLSALRSYVRTMRPAIIGVDGGADAVLEAGWRPHLVFGDMDSVSSEALEAADHVLVHGYSDGSAPGLQRVRTSGIKNSEVLRAPGLSEDVALLVAEQCGAELIVAVGTHVGLVEFLDKKRKGASSTFLTRLKVGSLLVDAKGVSKLYPTRPSVGQLAALVAAGLVTVSAIAYSSELVKDFFQLLALKLRIVLGL
jgi:uncharacterized membrane-anchored protein